MQLRKPQEVLIGDEAILDLLASRHRDMPEHPLQEQVEVLIEELLTDREKEVFYLRFGEGVPFRAIAAELGYASQHTIQRIVGRIVEKIGSALDHSNA